MTPQERDLILGAAQRLRSINLSQKDLEAERLIREQIGSVPDALYLLTQSVIVQEQGLRQAQERIQQLEAASSQQQGQGGFLSSLFGGGAAAPPPPPPSPATYPAAGGQSGVGTFLSSAAAAAVGSIGGNLIYDGMRHLLAGSTSAQNSGLLGDGGFYGGNFTSVGPSDRETYQSQRSDAVDTADKPSDSSWQGSGGDFGPTEDSGGAAYGQPEDEAGGDYDDQDQDQDDTDDGEFSDSDDNSGGGDF